MKIFMAFLSLLVVCGIAKAQDVPEWATPRKPVVDCRKNWSEYPIKYGRKDLYFNRRHCKAAFPTCNSQYTMRPKRITDDSGKYGDAAYSCIIGYECNCVLDSGH